MFQGTLYSFCWPYIFSERMSQRALPRECPHFSQKIQVSFWFIQQENKRTKFFTPAKRLNQGLGTPPKVKNIVPNQIYLMWVWCVFWVMICLTANSRPLLACLPSQTKLKPPLPNSFIFQNPQGKRSPNVLSSSSVSPKLQLEPTELRESYFYCFWRLMALTVTCSYVFPFELLVFLLNWDYLSTFWVCWSTSQCYFVSLFRRLMLFLLRTIQCFLVRDCRCLESEWEFCVACLVGIGLEQGDSFFYRLVFLPKNLKRGWLAGRCFWGYLLLSSLSLKSPFNSIFLQTLLLVDWTPKCLFRLSEQSQSKVSLRRVGTFFFWNLLQLPMLAVWACSYSPQSVLNLSSFFS